MAFDTLAYDYGANFPFKLSSMLRVAVVIGYGLSARQYC